MGSTVLARARLVWLLLLLLSVSAVSSAAASCVPHADLVTHIPGTPETNAQSSSSSSCWYSGYIHYELFGRQVHTHYTLITAEAVDDDTDDDDEKEFASETKKDVPLIYWSNGGPGASSLFGLLTELGPLLLNDGSLQTESYRATGIPTLLYNPHAWTRLGHVLAFDQPAPVGFSYCNNNSSSRSSSSREGEDNPHSCGGLAWTDELTAQAAHAALLGFYEIFPQYQTNALYLTGESYAGIYIPTLAREIVARNSAEAFHHHNNNNNTVFEGSSSTRNRKRINLVGFAVGDGCLGTQTGICGNINPDDKDRLPFDVWNILFLFGHGQLPMQTFNEVMQACYDPNTNDVWWKTTESGEPERLGISQSVLRHLAAAKPSTTTSTTTTSSTMKQQTSHVAERDDASCQASLQKVNQQVGGVYAYGLYDECTYRNGLMSRSNAALVVDGGINDYPCGGDLVMMQYLNLPIVKEAFHVESDFFSVDNAEGDFDYTPTEPDLTGFYRDINGKLRVLVYNGDTDPAINSFAAQNWTSHLGLREKESWRPWTVDSCRRMGGYVTRYEGDFDFLTIRGAGHMVPANKAEAAFTFMRSWINNDNYPEYDKDCVSP